MRLDSVILINRVLQDTLEQTMMNREHVFLFPLPQHRREGIATLHILIFAYRLLHQTGIVVIPAFPTTLKLFLPIPID
jgi:hypothetical protein